MARRSEYDIRADMLMLCKTPRRRTAIVYKCNLNFNVLKRYLRVLIGAGHLIACDNEYETTDDGKLWLVQAEQLGIGTEMPPIRM